MPEGRGSSLASKRLSLSATSTRSQDHPQWPNPGGRARGNVATLILLQNVLPQAASWTSLAGRGGHAMFVLQWLRGLHELGHDVLFVNWAEREPPAVAQRYLAQVMETWWHPSRTALVVGESFRPLWGAGADQVSKVARRADGLITVAIAGGEQPPSPLADIRPRILVDQDPGYSHLWAQLVGSADKVFGVHDLYFTVGANVGTSRCAVPTFGLRWIPTWNPVALDVWKPEAPVVRDQFTTIADWWGGKYLEFEGRVFGPKREEFLKFLDLPRHSGENIHLALDIPPGDPDIRMLECHGWEVESPALLVSPEGYAGWIGASLGEFSCAKGVYVGTQCGWFSDRSACYLAAGRPVVVQDTGFGHLLPTREGLFAVRNLEEATEAFHAIRRDYPRHSKAARRIAVEHFQAAHVLPRLLAEAGISG